MFVRFVVAERDIQSQQQNGIFQACSDLRDAELLDASTEAWAHQILVWFGAHLPQPDRLAWSSRPNAPERGISWFRTSATEHVLRARELASLLELCGVQTKLLRTDRPCYVLYEDEWQVVALPFADRERAR
jgi:hypothetical protein